MDGLTFLSKLMMASPLPVIMVSTLTQKGADVTIKALELGAVDFMLKPHPDNENEKREFSRNLIEKVLVASEVTVKQRPAALSMKVEEKYTADVILARRDPMKNRIRSEKVVAIGASTGGTEVIDEILENLDETVPGIVITQHMPEKFTEAFANRVNTKSSMLVKEAANGDRLYKGIALIAPGGRHMLLRGDGNGYYVEVNDGPPVNRHKPAVDVLFRSVSQVAGKSAVGIICTGMGNAGAAGLLEMKQAGAHTIGQNEKSCIVYGMPKEAFKLGGVTEERDIAGIIRYIREMD
jgi:two-component system chemotaxis response regulator CheB